MAFPNEAQNSDNAVFWHYLSQRCDPRSETQLAPQVSAANQAEFSLAMPMPSSVVR